jgi:hypothetical protein
MKYIVWRNPYKSYNYEQVNGYFVKWKNKCSDEFSPNWFDAKKYKTIGPAITRLGLSINNQIKSMDDFYRDNPLDTTKIRDKKISEILDESETNFLFFKKGHIDKIDDNGNFIGNANEEILEYIRTVIDQNLEKCKSLQRQFEKLGIKSEPKVDVSSEDYLNDFLEMFN